jgi:hypothetical protein
MPPAGRAALNTGRDGGPDGTVRISRTAGTSTDIALYKRALP